MVWQFCFAVLAMSVLRQIWEPPPEPAEPAPRRGTKVRGWKNRLQVDEDRAARSRSPKGRHSGVKAMLHCQKCAYWKAHSNEFVFYGVGPKMTKIPLSFFARCYAGATQGLCRGSAGALQGLCRGCAGAMQGLCKGYAVATQGLSGVYAGATLSTLSTLKVVGAQRGSVLN